MKFSHLLSQSKIKCVVILFALTLTLPVCAQEVEDELPATFFGTWVEDFSQCNDVPPLSIVDAEEGLIVSGSDWYSSEVKVKANGEFYTLFIIPNSEDGEFETEINLKMGENGELILMYSETEEVILVDCNLVVEADIPMELLEEEEVMVADLETVEEVVELEELVEKGEEVEELGLSDEMAVENFDTELLQGIWQAVEDESSFLIIEENRMRMFVEGTDEEVEEEVFILSETCRNDSDKDNDSAKEENRYLSTLASDMCWYIVYVDEINLSLVYLSRGNTITYRRVE